MSSTPERLSAGLARLAVHIDTIAVDTRPIVVPSYGGPRPHSLVTLAGGDRHGAGEHVGWTEDAHAAFRAAIAATLLRGRWTLGTLRAQLAAAGLPPYDRAAIEGAAIALALAQSDTTLAELAGVAPRPVRTVVSFARRDDPAAEARRHPGAELKVDVDPSWPDATWQALAATGRVVILDWKGTGDAPAYARALAHVPDALHEDPAPPYPEAVRRSLSLDQPITAAAVLHDLAPVACNVKPARMGGVLEAIEAAALCVPRGIAVYVGGMFEVGVGRGQLRDLAAILCPDAPNDLAAIPLADAPPTPYGTHRAESAVEPGGSR